VIAKCIGKALLLLGVGLLGLASWEYFASAGDQRVTVDEQDLWVDVERPGVEVTVVFHVHNSSHKPVRVVGLSQC
jgi:hypothetical protein